MLILGRGQFEEIVLNFKGVNPADLENLEVRIMPTKIQRDKVSIGIKAPREVHIVRAELLPLESVPNG